MFGGEIDKDGVYFPPGEVEVKHHALGFQMPTTGGKNMMQFLNIQMKRQKLQRENQNYNKLKFHLNVIKIGNQIHMWQNQI